MDGNWLIWVIIFLVVRDVVSTFLHMRERDILTKKLMARSLNEYQGPQKGVEIDESGDTVEVW